MVDCAVVSCDCARCSERADATQCVIPRWGLGIDIGDAVLVMVHASTLQIKHGCTFRKRWQFFMMAAIFQAKLLLTSKIPVRWPGQCYGFTLSLIFKYCGGI